MKEVYYIYNNEAISSCIFLSVINKINSIDFARSCLILPFLLDDQTVVHLLKNQDIVIDLDLLIKDKPRLFTSFNKRYLALLPITINTLMLLNKSNQIKIADNIYANENTFIPPNLDYGLRYNRISKVLPSFLEIIEKYSTVQLYQILNIQL